MSAEPPDLVIEAGRQSRLYWSDLWRYRELFRSWPGATYPCALQADCDRCGLGGDTPGPYHRVFTVVFGKLAQLPSFGTPYAVLVCAAILPWQLFASAFSEAGNSLIVNSALVSKVYFPRIILPRVP